MFLAFVNLFGFAVIIPVLPGIVSDQPNSELLYGLILSIYALFQYLTAPFWGKLSDLRGRRSILLLTQFGTLISWGIFAISYFFQEQDLLGFNLAILLIIIARSIDGFTGGNSSVLYAYITDTTNKANRSRAFGLVGVSSSLALLVAPVVGGITGASDIGYLGTALVSIAVSFLALLILFFTLEESLEESLRTATFSLKYLLRVGIFSRLKTLDKDNILNKLFRVRLIVMLVFTGFTNVSALYLLTEFEMSELDYSLILVYMGVSLLITQGLITPIISKRYGDLNTFYLGVLLIGLSLLFLPFVISVNFLLVTLYFFSAGAGLMLPSYKAALTSIVPGQNQGEISGLDESLISLTNALTPITIAALFGFWGSYSFLLMGSALLIVFLVRPVQQRILSELEKLDSLTSPKR